MLKLDLEKAEEPEIKLPTSFGSQKKQDNYRKKIYLFFIGYTKAFDCVDHKICGKFLEMGVTDHFTSLLRNLHARQEVTVRTGHGTMNWLQIGKGVHQGCIVSPGLFNRYVDHHVKCWAG